MKIEGNFKNINIFGLIITTQKSLDNMQIDIHINKEDIDKLNKGLSYYNGEWKNGKKNI